MTTSGYLALSQPARRAVIALGDLYLGSSGRVPPPDQIRERSKPIVEGLTTDDRRAVLDFLAATPPSGSMASGESTFSFSGVVLARPHFEALVAAFAENADLPIPRGTGGKSDGALAYLRAQQFDKGGREG